MGKRTISKITINAPSSNVWEALTKPELVKQWQYGTDVRPSWQKGSPIVYHHEWEGTVYEQKGTILEIEPDRLVKYTLFAPRPDLDEAPENSFTMTYLLEESNGKTMLSIIQDDPREQPSETQAEEGGNSVLHGLKKLVEGSVR